MKLLRKIKSLCKRYILDIQFRNKVNLIPEIALVVYGLISSKYSVIFFGCVGIAILNLILNSIAKKLAIKEIKKQFNVVSNQTTNQEKSDEDIINL